MDGSVCQGHLVFAPTTYFTLEAQKHGRLHLQPHINLNLSAHVFAGAKAAYWRVPTCRYGVLNNSLLDQAMRDSDAYQVPLVSMRAFSLVGCMHCTIGLHHRSWLLPLTLTPDSYPWLLPLTLTPDSYPLFHCHCLQITSGLSLETDLFLSCQSKRYRVAIIIKNCNCYLKCVNLI